MLIRSLSFLGISSLGFYQWDSGLPQISHLLLLSGFILYAIKHKLVINDSSLYPLIAFGILSLFLNTVYFIIFEDISFLVSSIQIIFNIFLYFFILTLLINDAKFSSITIKAISLGLMIQLIIYILGKGNYTYDPRYSGTLNDPNQMAFWSLTSTVIFMIISKALSYNKIYSYLILLISTFLIILTISRSGLISLTLLIATFIGANIYKAKKIYKNIIITITILITGFIIFPPSDYKNTIPDINIDVVERIIATDLIEHFDERGYSRFFDFPEYIIFGSGQGNHERFNQDKKIEFISLEMHTTWGGILHYYGFLGFLLIGIFLYKILKNCDLYVFLLIFSTFIYGLSTYSFRSSMFWILIAVAAYYAKLIKNKKYLKILEGKNLNYGKNYK